MFLRHRERLLADGPALWFNPPADLPWREFPSQHDVKWQTQDEAARLALANTGLDIQLHAVPTSGKKFSTIVLSVPREKSRLRLLAAAMTDRLAPGGVMYLAGELRAGGRSAPAQLEDSFVTTQKLDSARHCVLFAVRDPLAREAFNLSNYQSVWSLECPGRSPLQICSYPGVFADGTLDPGTELLLGQLDQLINSAAGRALDLGCGAGVIGASLLRSFPDWSADMVDSNALAITATRETLARNKLDAHVFASDGLSAVNARYDLIISNPPFHAGHRERADLGAGIFDQVGNFLSPRGQLVLVANRHLPWSRWMSSTFSSHRVLAANNKYHVLLAGA